MSTWRVEQHYGFGAANIPIRSEAHRAAPMSLVEGMSSLVGEMTEGGVLATTRRLAGQMPALALGLLILAAFFVTLSQDHSDRSPIEVVLFEAEPPLPPPPVVEEPVLEKPIEKPPEPIPLEIAKPEPPRPVVPRPPPPQLAKRPPAPRPPPPRVQPKPRPRPKPVIPQIARIEAPKPPAPPKQIERVTRERVQPVARPRVAIDLARPEPRVASVTPRPERTSRATIERVKPARITPRLDAPAAPALGAASEAPPKRAFRVASTRPASGDRPRALPGIAPAPKLAETPPPQGARPARTHDRRPAPTQRSRAPAPRLSTAPVPVAPTTAAAAPQRATRQAPVPSNRRGPRPAAAVAGVQAQIAPPAPQLASRTGRAAPEVPRGTSADRPGVAGVPLGDLAACVTDREEDRLKQAVVAAVTTQKECVSRKGTYRFVETKNLNAFLMWIDRAPGRPVSDRCVELSYALECLESAGQRAAR